MAEPLALPPPRPYLHPVDVDSDAPGIVDCKWEGGFGKIERWMDGEIDG